MYGSVCVCMNNPIQIANISFSHSSVNPFHHDGALLVWLASTVFVLDADVDDFFSIYSV